MPRLVTSAGQRSHGAAANPTCGLTIEPGRRRHAHDAPESRFPRGRCQDGRVSTPARGVWRRRPGRVAAAVGGQGVGVTGGVCAPPGGVPAAVAATVVALRVVAPAYAVAGEETVPAPPLDVHGHRVRT